MASNDLRWTQNPLPKMPHQISHVLTDIWETLHAVTDKICILIEIWYKTKINCGPRNPATDFPLQMPRGILERRAGTPRLVASFLFNIRKSRAANAPLLYRSFYLHTIEIPDASPPSFASLSPTPRWYSFIGDLGARLHGAVNLSESRKKWNCSGRN